jgi:MoxR-like ATPase
MDRDFISSLKSLENIQTETHSGSYELVSQGVMRLSKVVPENIGVNDLEMLFHFGNLRHGKDIRDRNILVSNLHEEDKLYMLNLNSEIEKGAYTNSGLEDSHKSNGNCGLFIKGLQTLLRKSDKLTAQVFIEMLVTISPMDDKNEILLIAEKCLSNELKGLGAGIASQILHLLKPDIFPILNSVGRKGYEEKIGLPLVNSSDIRFYIQNTRIINDFRNKELPGLNFRTIDVALWEEQSNILSSKSEYLEDDFIEWMTAQRKSNGEPYSSNVIKGNYRRALKKACSELTDIEIEQSDLFFQTNASEFKKLHDAIRQSKFFDEISRKYNNYAFSAAMNLYEKFLFEREAESEDSIQAIEELRLSKDNILSSTISLKKLAIKVLEDTLKPMTDIEIWEYVVDKGWDKQLNSVGKTPWQSIYAILSNYKDGIPNPDERIEIIDSEQRRKFLINRDSVNVDYFETKQLSLQNGKYYVDIDITVEEWKTMLHDKGIFDVLSLDMVRKWYLYEGHQATSGEIMLKYGSEYSHLRATPFNGIVSGLSKRILDYLNRFVVSGADGSDVRWCVPFEGWYEKNRSSGSFVWKLRDELVRAIDELQLFEFPKTPYDKNQFFSEVYMTADKYEDIKALLKRKKNIILQGPPGVGKSYLAKRLAYSIIGLKDTNKVQMVQFHQSYSYEDFIEGFRPEESGNFGIKQGIFNLFCQKAVKDDKNDYFFIIDEINRGNLSKIMGELMLLIESDKRGEEHAMPLTYSGKRFYVPDNVYVIGMMNTADRSLAMLDYALRRRFSFVPIEPAFDNENFVADFKANYTDADKVIEKMFNLNKLIADELDSGHQIGHSYFCSDKPFKEKDIEGIFKYEIVELLREYFFDNSSKLDEALKLL